MHKFRSLFVAVATAALFTHAALAQPVTTIITHGFTLDQCDPRSTDITCSWMRDMADAIILRSGGQGAIRRYDPTAGEWIAVSGSVQANEPIILLFDWIAESDGDFFLRPCPPPGEIWGYAEAAGDALYAAIRDPSGDLPIGLDLLVGRKVHFIGHSRGTVVNSYAVSRLATDSIPVDQVTTLDPHPVNGQQDTCGGSNPGWGDSTPVKWTNVAWADNYRRADGADLALECDPDGNQLLIVEDNDLTPLLGDTGGFPDFDFVGTPCSLEHSKVHAWYAGTIAALADPCGECSIDFGNWYLGGGSKGYDYSFIGGASRPPQDLGIAAPLASILFNGGFDNGAGIATLAGWLYHHSSASSSTTLVPGSNPYLQLTPASTEITHNRFLVPECGTKTLTMTARRDTSAGPNDALQVLIRFADGSNPESILGPVPASSLTTSFTPLSASIPSDYDGRSCELIILTLDTAGGSITTTVGIEDVIVSTGEWMAEIGQPGVGGPGTPCNGVLFLTAFTTYGNHLIAGGNYYSIGGQTVNFISRWNGSAWQSLGGGMNCQVEALTTFGSELIAGGYFTTAGGQSANRIARWNGSAWQSLLSGMNDTVHALGDYNGQLIAGGQFTTAGGVSANRVASWNGSSWQPLGSGVSAVPPGPGVGLRALAVYNGELIAGGQFTTAGGVSANYIARWNGSAWQSLGTGMNANVQALTVFNGELIAGGLFITAGGQSANRIARWNGSSWQPMGTGMNQDVYALTVHNGELFAGGSFTSAGGQPANKIARWTGSTWSPLGSGLSGTSDIYVRALQEYDGMLAVGGKFSTAGGLSANSVALWKDNCAATDCPADLDVDGSVNGMDLALLLGQWTGAATYSPCPPVDPADLNGDCRVNGIDLAMLLADWGPCSD